MAPLALPSASAGATTTAERGTRATGRDRCLRPVHRPATAASGTWTVAEATAGYRVREQLANLPAESDAVGRTNDVTGSITLVEAGDGAQLTAGSLTVDTTTLVSDESRRDNRLRSEGLETDASRPRPSRSPSRSTIPAAAVAGTATDVTLAGDLTLHGVTKPVDDPGPGAAGRRPVQVVGSLTFPLADFDITAPNVGGFIISIADEGTLEFLVVFERG